MRFSIPTISILSALAAGVVNAYTQPNFANSPTGNAIVLPGLNEQVPAGSPYTITWKPSTPGKVSLVLLRGPSTNAVPFETIVEDIDNSGSYVWTPETSLEPDVSHYGILLVVEGTGQYQYSTQFGIKNDHYVPAASSSAAAVPTPATTSVAVVTREAPQEPTTTSAPGMVPVDVVTTTMCDCTKSSTPTPAASSATPTASSFVSVPAGATKTASVSGTPSPEPPVFTGAAGRNTAMGFGGVIAAGVAALVAF
ncbi:hypothetical protein VTN00DRAFT_531 [Thermoascus crustaceus]|uniref:uncharacterized protein n=1 Tax=Thermoascus crustaceus TaxID=5088 RepID=UPI0037448100